MKVFPEANIEQYLGRLDERTDPSTLRAAPQRADHLRRVGAILARDDVLVELDPTEATARISPDRTPSAATEPCEIRITSRGLPQPVTNYSREAYDLLVQETLLVHEIGHFQYTDFDALRRVADGVDPERLRAFTAIFDAAEDVAIEAQLRAEFSVAEEFEVLNANVFAAVDFDGAELSIPAAVELAILELGVWETGRLDALLSRSAAGPAGGHLGFRSPAAARTFREDVLPLVRTLVGEMAATADGEARVLLVESFWRRLLELLPESEREAGDGEWDTSQNSLKPDDGDPDRQGEAQPAEELAAEDANPESGDAGEAGGQGERSPAAGSVGRGPDDGASEPTSAGETAGDAQDDASGERTEGGAETDRAADPSGADVGDSSEDDETERGSTRSRDPTDSDAERSRAGEAEDPWSVDTRPEVEQAYGAEARSTSAAIRQTRDALADDLEETIAALSGASDDFAGIELEVPMDPAGDYDRSTYDEATRVAGWIARELGDRLRQEERQRPRRRRSAGRLDSKRLHAWDRGDYRIFERTKTGGEKDYNAMFVADRSSSMGGYKIDALERSLGGLALGLEELGVRSAVMDLYCDEGRLVKPFDVPVDSRRPFLFSGTIGGSTPLDEVLAVARERLEAEGGNRFLVLLTDGQVESMESFKAQVARCNFPVLGIYLAMPYQDMDELTYLQPSYDYPSQLALFDRYRIVFDRHNLDRVLEEFCREFMF